MIRTLLLPIRWVCSSVWISAAAFLLFICAVLPVMHTDQPWMTDEGAYHLQVEALRSGTWNTPDPAYALDSSGKAYPYANTLREGNNWFVAVPRPLWPELLRVGQWLGGDTYGFLMWCVLGTVGTCMATWAVAERFRKGSGALAFWITAVSPVMFSSFMPWAHAPDAALCGLGLLGCVRFWQENPGGGKDDNVLKDGNRWVTAALMTLPFAVGCLLRSETLLVAAGLIGVMFVLEISRRNWRRALILVGSGAVVLVCVVGNELWVRAIVGGRGHYATSDPTQYSYLGGRLNSAVITMIRSSGFDRQIGLACFMILASACCAIFCARKYLPQFAHVIVPIAIGCVALSHVWRALAVDDDTVSGLFAAWPLVPLTAFAVAPDVKLEKFTMRMWLGTAVSVFILAGILIQPEQGGGVEWGGRYYSPIVPLLAVLVGSSAALRWMLSLNLATKLTMLMAGVIPISTGLVGCAALREDGQFDNEILALPGQYLVTRIHHFPRLHWRMASHVNMAYAFGDDLGPTVQKAYKVSGQPVIVVQSRAEQPLPNTCRADIGPGARKPAVYLYPATACVSS